MSALLIYTLVLIVALGVLLKASDWFVEGAEHIGLGLGVSPFIVGVTIVAFGTFRTVATLLTIVTHLRVIATFDDNIESVSWETIDAVFNIVNCTIFGSIHRHDFDIITR